jgi:5'-nucleotidase
MDSTRVRILGLALVALALIVPATAQAKPRDVEVQLLGLNDFHGNLEPPTGSSGRILPAPGGTNVDAGGAAFLATHIRQMRATNPNSLVVSAGDLIGASPLLSAAFHDEPTIEAMNEIGLDLNAVGNHEFDEGEAELLRMQRGGCHPTDAAGTCKDADGSFDGANFEFLAANVVRRDTGRPLFAPYEIRKFGNIKVGFIGMTLEGTPDIVSPSGIRNLQFLDEAETANHYARELRHEHGVRAIVVLLH